MIWVLFVCALLAYFILYVRKKHSYWEDKGVPYMEPKFLLGSFQLFRKKSWSELVREFYEAHPGSRYHGGYMFLQPFLFIKDLKLAKQILVKDFDHFTDRRTVIPDDIDPLWGRNLTNVGGELWKNLRSTLSPTFTGSKMKMMFHLMEQCAEQFIDNFKDEEAEVIEVNMKDALSRYSNDVIASTAFGVECNSFKNKNNEFFTMGQDINSLSFFRMLRMMAFMISPTLTRLFRIKAVPSYIANYFTKLIEDTVKMREEQNVVRPDLIHLLMEVKKGQQSQKEEVKVKESFAISPEIEHQVKPSGKYQMTIQDITSQAFIFFLAGFETTSTLLSFTLYELALQPDLQDRLREEVNEVPGKIDYEKLLKMKYLDMVVCETLRKWAPANFTDRVVTKEYTIPPEQPGEKPLTLPVGSGCMIPVIGIHRDPKYYPDPEKFDPDRFSEENKDKIVPFSYLPFGAGPRFCIGNRFALQEGKLLLFHIIKNFEVVPIKKTLIPIVLDPNLFGPNAKGGMWLGLKKIAT